jgi:DNA-binding MarR family transcriptional regulator
VARGLVTRETDANNRRSVVITLTESGWAVIEDVLVHHVAHEERVLACLTGEQQQQLATLLRTLLLGLGDVPAEAMPAAPQERVDPAAARA